MRFDKHTTAKGCLEYVEPDLRTMGIPIKIPPGFTMYRVCGNGSCMNPQHMYFVDGDAAHRIECDLREITLGYLRKFFKVDPATLEQLAKKEGPNDQFLR